MVSKYDISTKDKKEMSYRTFVFVLLINLGFNPSNKGTFYLRDLILIAINNIEDIGLKELRKQLANKKHISQTKIKTNIDYAKRVILFCPCYTIISSNKADFWKSNIFIGDFKNEQKQFKKTYKRYFTT